MSHRANERKSPRLPILIYAIWLIAKIMSPLVFTYVYTKGGGCGKRE